MRVRFFRIRKPNQEVALRLRLNALKRDHVGVAEAIEHVGELGVFRCPRGVDNLPKRRGLRRRRLSVEVAQIVML